MADALIIMDGFGLSSDTEGNAIYASGTPYIKTLMDKYPNTTLGASGIDVGLPQGQMGNSEVGHINIGAGRVVYQELTRISKAIEEGDFFENESFLLAVKNAKNRKKALHLFGLLSDGGVHSHIDHLYALIKLAKEQGLDDVYVHCFLDGRDVSPTSGAGFLADLQDYMDKIEFGTIASVMGRYYAMDRDNRWERVEKAYVALVDGEGNRAKNAVAAVRKSYEEGITDEFVKPTIIYKNGHPIPRIGEGDSIIFFNFRPDRAREITRAFTKKTFDNFERKKGFLRPTFVGLTQYDITFTRVETAFKPQSLSNNFGKILADNGLKQLRIAETEKYAHVTFFFNSGVEEPNTGEDRILIPSPKVTTYDLKPEMSAFEVADTAVKLIYENIYDVIILNFANCDMVGHTGNFDATVKAVETVDKCVQKVTEALLATGGRALITSDHGNAEQMLDKKDSSVFTAHSTNPVPFILVSNDKDIALREGGTLADIAPTMLELLRMEKPIEMRGESLIIRE